MSAASRCNGTSSVTHTYFVATMNPLDVIVEKQGVGEDHATFEFVTEGFVRVKTSPVQPQSKANTVATSANHYKQPTLHARGPRSGLAEKDEVRLVGTKTSMHLGNSGGSRSPFVRHAQFFEGVRIKGRCIG